MGSTESTATSGKVFSPPSWRPNDRKSKKENVSSFRLYTIEMKMKMDRHLELLEQGNLKVENNKERGEKSNKRRRGVEKNGCGEWPVIIVDSDNDEGDKKGKEGVGAEEKKEDVEEEDNSEEDEETDESTESDLNSNSRTESEKEGVADLDEEMESSGDSYKEDDDDNIGAGSSFGNNEEGNLETSEDSSMFRSYGLLELGSDPDLGDYSDGDNGSSFDSDYKVIPGRFYHVLAIEGEE
ncbi:protein PFC0760c-like [Chenopodium quinoa]|uniref:protein PFC0760c-like n=1 Tax=Chenopodium quinoa TaxID=63459 RepID=UPI000B781CF0|nr:protein PFC0760c-like [Chenopodium quinoa]